MAIYRGPGGPGDATTDATSEGIVASNAAAAALGDDPAFITTVGTNLSNHTNATTSVHGIADTDDLATKDYVANAVSNATVDQQALAGVGIDYNTSTDQFDIDSTVVTLTGIQTLSNKTLSSPQINGATIDTNSVAVTQIGADNSTKIATTAFVQNRISTLIDSSPSALDTLNELAAALGNDENFATTVTNSLGTKLSKAGDTMTGNLTLSGAPSADLHAATKKYVDDEIVSTETTLGNNLITHENATTNVHGIDDTSALATKSYADNALSTHASDSTDVHGIANTADLATKSYADNALSTHASDSTNVHGIDNTADLATKSYADNALSTHSSDTTDVHGIVDTAELATKAYADAAATHNAVTTDVHGISNTANLVVTSDARLSDTRTPTDNTVTTAKIVDSNVTADKLAGDSVTESKIADGAVTSGKIADGTIVNADINASAAIDWTKLAVSSTVTESDLGLITGLTGPVQTQLDALASTSSVSAHTGATTSVHGISDTSQLAYLNAANQTFTGNMEVDGNIVVDGNLTVNGTSFNASSTTIVIEDNMVQLAHQNSANTVDLGLVVAYNDGTVKHAGFVRDVSANEWKLFKGVSTEPTTTVDFSQGSLDDLELNNLAAAGIIFTDGTQTKEGVPSQTTIIQKTAAYTLSALTERDDLIEVSHTGGTAVDITIPTDSTLNFPIGTSIDVLRTNTGGVRVVGAAGVTVNSTPGAFLRAQWSSATLFKRAANTWVLIGDLATA